MISVACVFPPVSTWRIGSVVRTRSAAATVSARMMVVLMARPAWPAWMPVASMRMQMPRWKVGMTAPSFKRRMARGRQSRNSAARYHSVAFQTHPQRVTHTCIEGHAHPVARADPLVCVENAVTGWGNLAPLSGVIIRALAHVLGNAGSVTRTNPFLPGVNLITRNGLLAPLTVIPPYATAVVVASARSVASADARVGL